MNELSLVLNYIVDNGYDNGDNHHHYGFYPKKVLIAAFYGVHEKYKA